VKSCRVPAIRHFWDERGCHDARYERCGNGLPCVHHGSAQLSNDLAVRMSWAIASKEDAHE
jgi:hypothetical protein